MLQNADWLFAAVLHVPFAQIHEGVGEELAKHGVQGSMSVKLHESHNAWATYTNKIGAS